MAECEYGSELSAYHDGELSLARRTLLEQHLPLCPTCNEELSSFQTLSLAFGGMPVVLLPQTGLARCHDQVGAAVLAIGRDRRLMRFAQALSAMAACLLVGASIWISRPASDSVKVSQARPWEQVAVTLQTEIPSTGGTDMAADWVLADASSDSSRVANPD